MKVWRAVRKSLPGRNTINGRYFSYSTPRSRRHRGVAGILQSNADAETVSVEGWVRSARRQKRIAFVAIGDGSTIDPLQAVLKPEDAAQLSTGTAVRLQGDWKASTGSKQSHELQVSTIEVLGENDAETNPLQPKYQTAEYLRTIPHLRPRIPSNALLLRLRSQLIARLTRFFDKNDFVQMHTPIITSSDCEGAGEVFMVSSANTSEQKPSSKSGDEQGQHFFRTPKYLTVSAQLHLEALAQAVPRVWTLSPTFRAEKSDTPRHLSEFYMLEAEVSFTQDLDEIMDLVENMLRSAVMGLKDSPVLMELVRTKQMAVREQTAIDVDDFVSAEALQNRWDGICAPDWPRITYASAIETLRHAHETDGAKFTFNPSYEDGLQAEHERYIASNIGEGKPVFVTHYPRTQKPFYMPPSSSNTKSPSLDADTDTVACFDLLVPDLCELVGGSLREHRSTPLRDAMEAKGVAAGSLDWYQDLRKYGGVPHGGFGLGFDRLLCYLAGVGNVRDVVAFPRWVGRCEC